MCQWECQPAYSDHSIIFARGRQQHENGRPHVATRPIISEMDEIRIDRSSKERSYSLISPDLTSFQLNLVRLEPTQFMAATNRSASCRGLYPDKLVTCVCFVCIVHTDRQRLNGKFTRRSSQTDRRYTVGRLKKIISG